MSAAPNLDLARCEACHSRFLPSDGPCPRCGSLRCVPYSASPIGKVLAATELQYPAAGWTAPHRLVLVELTDAVRVLAIGEGPLPMSGTLVEVSHDNDVYRARREPSS